MSDKEITLIQMLHIDIFTIFTINYDLNIYLNILLLLRKNKKNRVIIIKRLINRRSRLEYYVYPY